MPYNVFFLQFHMVHSGPLRDISVISVISDQYAVGGGGGGLKRLFEITLLP